MQQTPNDSRHRQPRAVTIAGSDSGGGAGIQADLKTFAMMRVFGCSVVTALTAQNTQGVHDVQLATRETVRAQLDAVLPDIAPLAGKTGMLATVEIIDEVAEGLARHRLERLVVDPVMVSKHGDRLLAPEAEEAMRDRMLPCALLVTPNLPEAEVLTGMGDIESLDQMREAARALHQLGARNVLVKGGHLPGHEVVDLLFDGNDFAEFRSPRIDSPHTHGTGCTLSAAVTAWLAWELPVRDAVERARRYLRRAIETAAAVGQGIGPVNHIWPLEENAAQPPEEWESVTDR